jgi:drug/metabolite transporter superfamily protein YnfA
MTSENLLRDFRPENGGFMMIRERALKVLLVLAGLTCLAGLYPLVGAIRDGTATTIVRQDQMILGIYISLGVFLLIAARNPRQHRSLILFAGWSTLAHDGVMIVQGVQYHDLRGDLPGYTIIGVIGVALIVLTPAKQPKAAI